MKKIVTDSSNFKHLRGKNAYYVDKTKNIIEFFNLNNDIVLMPRPRRFGKTLFLSTIEYFFSNKVKDESLFEDTYIYNTNFFKEHFGKYPVVSITFKDVKEFNFEDMLEKAKNLIGLVVEKSLQGIDIYSLDNSKEKEILLKIIEDRAKKSDYEDFLLALTKILTTYYKTPCIVLIDEYDSPIITAYLKGYYEEAISFFRNMLSAVFKQNELNIKKALITGILRVSGESMFSGLNNIETITILENELSTSCGFTKEETIELLDYYGINKEMKEEALFYYNSYTIGDKIITNPWSILNFTKRKRFEAYWANTSSNDFLYNLIQKSKDFKQNLEKLLKDEPIEVKVNKNITFRDKELEEKDNLFSLLFFSGYLKCKEKYEKKIGRKRYLHCKMIPANVECQMIFEDVISDYVRDGFRNQSAEDLLQALIDGNLEDFSYFLEDILLETSYNDLKTENSYHMLLLGILLNLSNEYEIISNSEAGYGRVDIVLLHKEDRSKLAIVMELKKVRRYETKDEALKKAIKQIKDRGYISLAKRKGYENILAFGLVFDGKRCWIKEVKDQ